MQEMTTFYGFALAIYDTAPISITYTVLEGETKENIRVQNSQTTRIRFPTSRTVQQAFEKLEDVMRDIVTKADESVTVPVVAGMEEGYNAANLFKSLAHCYGTVPVSGLTDGSFVIRPTVDQTEYISRGLNVEEQGGAFIQCVSEILVHAVNQDQRKKLHIEEPRVFSSIGSAIKYERMKDPNVTLIGLDYIIPSHISEKLEELLTTWEAGDETVLPDLLEHARIYANLISKEYREKSRQPMTFVFARDELRSRLYLVPGARQAYGEAFISGLGLNHNIGVKGILDPRSPPFADVVATIMADYMDKRTGNKPGVVLVQHS